MGAIVSITYLPASVDDIRPAGHYARVPIDATELVAGHGIVGDLKGGSGKRQLNVMSAETLAVLASEGFKTAPGELGEQIVVGGIDVDVLQAGDRLRLGASAVIEVVIPRTGCGRFEKIQGHPKAAVRGRLGVMARVVEGGPIRVGDDVRWNSGVDSGQ